MPIFPRTPHAAGQIEIRPQMDERLAIDPFAQVVHSGRLPQDQCVHPRDGPRVIEIDRAMRAPEQPVGQLHDPGRGPVQLIERGGDHDRPPGPALVLAGSPLLVGLHGLRLPCSSPQPWLTPRSWSTGLSQKGRTITRRGHHCRGSGGPRALGRAGLCQGPVRCRNVGVDRPAGGPRLSNIVTALWMLECGGPPAGPVAPRSGRSPGSWRTRALRGAIRGPDRAKVRGTERNLADAATLRGGRFRRAWDESRRRGCVPGGAGGRGRCWRPSGVPDRSAAGRASG